VHTVGCHITLQRMMMEESCRIELGPDPTARFV
jgi:hypothetical protein